MSPMGSPRGADHVYHRGEAVKIDWPWIVTWDEPAWGGQQLPATHYTDYSETDRPEVRTVLYHWDVCLTSEQCFRTLIKRGVSVHLMIDNDGTIYQALDLGHVAWHGSSRAVNDHSIGIEMANPYYLKYADWYPKNGFGERPVVQGDTAHGVTLEDHLDFWPVQKAAAAALFAGLARHFGLPLAYPLEDGVNSLVADGKWYGAAGHKHATRAKIDPGRFNPLEFI